MVVHLRNKLTREEEAALGDVEDQLPQEAVPLMISIEKTEKGDVAGVARPASTERVCSNSLASAGAEEEGEFSKPHRSQAASFQTLIGSIPRVLKGLIFVAAIALGCFILLSSFTTSPFTQFLQPASYYSSNSQFRGETDPLDSILRNATMKDGKSKTVIMTILNDAWAKPDSMFDLFMESFRIGNGTAGLVKHLVVICMDDKAYARCSASHPHCYWLRTSGSNFTNEADFMSPVYLDLMWRRIEFLAQVLEMGYSFILTDVDIMWLRSPFQRFFKEADFQIACDNFRGDSHDLQSNLPNGGFQYVRSNRRTIQFYKFWRASRANFPGMKTQDVLNIIKLDPMVKKIGLRMMFLDTVYFGGFCEPSRDLNLVCTMHANCCVGLSNKINDLKLLLEDWKRYNSSSPSLQLSSNPPSPWSVPKKCWLEANIIPTNKDFNHTSF